MYGLMRLSRAPEVGGVVCDMGSNLGDFAISAALLFPRVQVIAVEPSPSTYFYLLWNLYLNNVTRLEMGEISSAGGRGGVLPLNRVAADQPMQVVCYVVQGRDTHATRIFVMPHPPCLSRRRPPCFYFIALPVLLRGPQFYWSDHNSMNAAAFDEEEVRRQGDPRRRFAHMANWSAAKVRPFRLTNFLQSRGIGRLAFLKVDCEGCEYKLMPALHAEGWFTKERVGLLSAELHAKYSPERMDAAAVNATLDAIAKRGCGRLSVKRTDLNC
jgi:hypothetical protein